jgi:hypothetical protein
MVEEILSSLPRRDFEEKIGGVTEAQHLAEPGLLDALPLSYPG